MAYITNTLGGSYYYLNIENGGDLLTAQAALNALDTSGGRGIVVIITAPVVTLSGTLNVPTRVILAGSSPRGTIVNGSAAGALFKFDSVEHAGLRNMRIGLGSNAGAIGVDILTSTSTSRKLEFSDLEIAGAEVSGQIGVRSTATGSQIVAECSFTRLNIVLVDRPVVETDTEGNFWTQITVDQFARSGVARSAFDCQSLASFYQVRVAGTVAAGSSAYKQSGARNIAAFVADIGSNSHAIEVSGAANIITIERPEALTPLGALANIDPSTTIIDGEGTILHRYASRGSLPPAANFSLEGFGSSATVSAISGNDQRMKFLVTAAGTGITANPTVGYEYVDGPWPTSQPIVQVTRDGGNQNSQNAASSAGTSTRWGFTFAATPVAGEAYAFVVTMG